MLILYTLLSTKWMNTLNKLYLTLLPTNERKGKLWKYEELWSKIRDLIRSITKISDGYDEKYFKIKFSSDGESIECLYKFWIIYKCYILSTCQKNKCFKRVWYLSLLAFLK